MSSEDYSSAWLPAQLKVLLGAYRFDSTFPTATPSPETPELKMIITHLHDMTRTSASCTRHCSPDSLGVDVTVLEEEGERKQDWSGEPH